MDHCKAIFARQGISEIVVSDTVLSFTRGSLSSSHSFGFTHLTSSPLFPQGNGEAERAVQTIKNLLKKAEDPYIALLNYRATPLQQGSSPAKLLMGRKLRTKVPSHPSHHIPKVPDANQFHQADALLKYQQKVHYDRRHRTRPL